MTKQTAKMGESRRVRAPWSGRILKPAVKPTSLTLAQIRKAVRDQRRSEEESALTQTAADE
jgi:hypothetical protein